MTTGDRNAVPVGTRAGTVGRSGAGATVSVVSPVPPRVPHPPKVTVRLCVGYWLISVSTR